MSDDEDVLNDPVHDETDSPVEQVGYGRPPKKHKFKPGQSGNPRGRVRGSRGLKTDLKAELSSRIRIVENGKTISITKQQVILKSLAAKAAKGDVRAINQIVSLTISMFGIEDERIGKVGLSLTEQAILDNFLNGRALNPRIAEAHTTDEELE